MPSKEYMELLDKLKETHIKKSSDYTTQDEFENFTRCAEVSSWFKNDIDKTFATFIAVKLARLASLLGRKTPNNESIEDSFMDLTAYSALWASYYKRKESMTQNEKPIFLGGALNNPTQKVNWDAAQCKSETNNPPRLTLDEEFKVGDIVMNKDGSMKGKIIGVDKNYYGVTWDCDVTTAVLESDLQHVYKTI